MALPTPPKGLRHWRLTDADSLAAAWADDSVRLWNPPPADADAASWISRCEERWSLRLSLDFVVDVNGEVGGEVGLRNFTEDPSRAELGIWVGVAYRRSGLALGAVNSVSDWVESAIGIGQLWCRTRPENGPAQKLFASAGWERLGEADGSVVFARTVETAG